jgi:hypothetical protein
VLVLDRVLDRVTLVLVLVLVRGAQQHRQAGYINQRTRHIAKRGKHLLVATILNQE